MAYYHALLSFEDEPKTVRCMFADLSESELRTQPVYNMLDLAPQGRGSWYASLDYGTRVNR